MSNSDPSSTPPKWKNPEDNPAYRKAEREFRERMICLGGITAAALFFLAATSMKNNEQDGPEYPSAPQQDVVNPALNR